MISVYEAPNELEAQMILNLLSLSDIPGELLGTDLPGAIGELPAIGLVKVRVSPDDVAEAKEIILEWESKQTFEPVDKPQSKFGVWTGFVLGALLATGLVLWFTYTPVSRSGADLNGDGVQDEFYFFYGGLLDQYDFDRNFDGQIDSTMDYSRGVPNFLELDDDFNGSFETLMKYRHGNLQVVEVDHDGDETVDYIERYESSVLIEADFIVGLGVVAKRQFFERGQLKRAFLDEDLDRKFDVIVRYDDLQEEIDRSTFK